MMSDESARGTRPETHETTMGAPERDHAGPSSVSGLHGSPSPGRLVKPLTPEDVGITPIELLYLLANEAVVRDENPVFLVLLAMNGSARVERLPGGGGFMVLSEEAVSKDKAS